MDSTFPPPDDVSSTDPESSDGKDTHQPEIAQPEATSNVNAQQEDPNVVASHQNEGNDGNDGNDGNADDNGKEFDTGGLPDLDAEGHAAVMTAALLEYYCLNRAAELLNNQPGSHGQYTRDSHEAQFLGRRLYAYKSRFLSSYGVLTDGIEGDDWEVARQYYRESLDVLGSAAMEGLDLNASRGALEDPNAVAAAAGAGGTTLDLLNPNLQQPGQEQPQGTTAQARPTLQRRITDRPHDETGNKEQQPESPRLPAFMDLIQRPPPPAPTAPLAPQPATASVAPASLLPSLTPQVSPTYTQQLGLSRYAAEFEEESIIGKGAYGAVYKVKHHVDGQVYAVKKIPLSASRLRQLQDGGMRELDGILKEIRTLARLEHQNVVRYFGAWAEYASGASNTQQVSSEIPAAVTTTNDNNNNNNNQEELSFSVVFEEDSEQTAEAPEESDHGIVFEESSNQAANHRSSIHQDRARQHSEENDEDDAEDDDGEDYSGGDDVQSISRRLSLQPPAPALSSYSDDDDDDDPFTDGTGGNNQLGRQIPGSGSGSSRNVPPITLHIQMSHHSLNLAQYLSPHMAGMGGHENKDHPRHCFHILPSLKLLLGVLSGVEYLHSKGIIHRDLKPANIFLATPDNGAESGATTNSNCQECDDAGFARSTYMIPRIGDFGLVADTSPEEGHQPAAPVTTRPVGTEFYRPPMPINKDEDEDEDEEEDESQDVDEAAAASDPSDVPRVDASLDVFALGVILFELLYKLDTRMERQMLLADLTCSSSFSISPSTGQLQRRQRKPHLPSDFVAKLGLTHELLLGPEHDTIVENIMGCIMGMVEPDSRYRSTCKDVRRSLEKVCGMLRDKGGVSGE